MSNAQRKRVVAIIPARYASQRLPGKPLADIAGKPMIQHVYERAARATLVHDVVVATDHERIASAVRGFGGRAVITSESCQSGTDRIAYVAKDLHDADIIVNVQGDEPLIESAMIDEAVRPLLNGSTVPVGTLVHRIEAESDLINPNIVKVVLDRTGACLYFSRAAIPFGRDRAPKDWLRHHVYFKHIGLYVFRRDFLLQYTEMHQTPLEQTEKLEQLRILEYGYAIRAVVTTYDSVPVDTPDDLERVRALIGRTS
jgi:3-deoxy-manno-octulosonate cytidylyltransferase (CMP-KDO synthetase)